MTYDDDPPEPTQEEAEHAEALMAAQNTPIKLEGLTFGMIAHVLSGFIEGHYSLSQRAGELLEKAIDKHVARLIDETTKERIAAKVDALIDQGFPEFDYSGRERSRTTVQELVMAELKKEHGDSYRGPRQTVAQMAVANAVAKLFEKELNETIVTIKADLKKQADAVFRAKLIEGMKEAIGLRS
jgi:hypothetical protein